MQRSISVLITLLLALWASNATALPGFPQIETVHFDLILGEQGMTNSKSAPNTSFATINPVRITDKDLLNFLADAIHTNWPAGAQLALVNFSTILLIHETHIFVVDDSGTNLIFDATTGINTGGTNIAFFKFDYDDPVIAAEPVTGRPHLNSTFYQIVTFTLYQLDFSSMTKNTSLTFQGLDVSQHNYDERTGIYSITDHVSVCGDGSLNTTRSVVAGEVTGTLKWKKVPGL